MTLSCMLLAGGRSYRMGRDKATIRFAGQPLWQRQLDVLQGLQPAALWISAATAPSWCPPKVEVVVDRTPSCGPLSGVAAGLRRTQTSHLLVLAIDLPRITAEHLHELYGFARPGVGVAPWHDNYFEPLCAIYPIEAVTVADEALIRSDASLQHFAQTLLRRSRVVTYDLSDGERTLYLNMNMPSDIPATAFPPISTLL